ncbi:MAG: hypothetical protein ABWX71_01350 [Aeromicrobium sp.]
MRRPAGLGDDWRGLSLTMPLKREAVPLVDELTERARLAGAAHPLGFDDGRRRGAHTAHPPRGVRVRCRRSAAVRRRSRWSVR